MSEQDDEMQNTPLKIGAVVLAAGLSQRMGQPKMILPWGETTVIGRVVGVLQSAAVQEIVVVTGGAHQKVEEALQGLPAKAVLNPNYTNGQMLLSLQTGLKALPDDVTAALVTLGDQPQIESAVVQAVMQDAQSSGANLILPSYQMRRGHPWLVHRRLWHRLLAFHDPLTLRDFLKQQAAEIRYLVVETPSILADLDTPEDYARQRPVI